MATVSGDPVATRLYQLCAIYLRAPFDFATDATTGAPVFTFSPALTAGEQTTFDRLVTLARSLITGITPEEWLAIQSDIDGLVTFQGLASPTLAQTVLAVKAQSRILRAILKN